MHAKVFKSLSKPVFWGGLPRDMFIVIFMFGLFTLILFHTIKALAPLFIIYLFLVGVARIDHRIFGILRESIKIKSHYY